MAKSHSGSSGSGCDGKARQRRPWVRRGLIVALGVLLALPGAALVSSSVATETIDGEVRIVARELQDGRVEFALQQRLDNDSWSDRQLPERRFFPTTAAIGSWLRSSPLTLRVSGSDTVVRIVARRLDDGRVEFALQQRLDNDSWSDRQLPRKRLFPTTATIGSWLHSTALTLDTPPDPGRTPSDDDSSAISSPDTQDPQDASPQEAEDTPPDNEDPEPDPQTPPPSTATPPPPPPPEAEETPPDKQDPETHPHHTPHPPPPPPARAPAHTPRQRRPGTRPTDPAAYHRDPSTTAPTAARGGRRR